MRDNHRIKMLDTFSPKKGNNSTASTIRLGTETRTCIVEQRVIFRTRHYRESLTDIQHRKP